MEMQNDVHIKSQGTIQHSTTLWQDVGSTSYVKMTLISIRPIYYHYLSCAHEGEVEISLNLSINLSK
jgi:hypothetical protein